jgi:hypothetical protein
MRDRAIVILAPRLAWLGPDDLARAYLHAQASGARAGLVILLGFADPEEIARREVAAPHVQHVGSRAIQRMADAVAIGADPLALTAASGTHRPRALASIYAARSA